MTGDGTGTHGRAPDPVAAAREGGKQPPLLDVRGLHVRFSSDLGPVQAVDGVSLAIQRGERIGLVGESGSGKTVTGLAIMGLVRSHAAVTGSIGLDGIDVLRLPARQRRRLCGDRMAMVFQSPLGALNPTMTIGDQVIEAIRAHRSISRREARQETIDLLARVNLPNPHDAARRFPHEFSGGMRQRAVIASALSCDPDLLIADEPTTALDVTIQAQIIDLLESLAEERGTAVMLITHDLSVLARFARRVVVMYAGRIVEDGPVETIYYHPSHPYTAGLMASVSQLRGPRDARLRTIAGQPPSLARLPTGCAFHPRCECAVDTCRVETPRLTLLSTSDGHRCACHRAGEPDATARQEGGRHDR